MKKRTIHHILVIRLSAMGDVAISVPVLTAFCTQYPSVKLTLLTKKIYADMFAHLPNCELIFVDLKGEHKGFLGLWKLFKRLQSLSIDAVADIHNVLRTQVLKLFFKAIGIPFYQIDKGRAEKKALTRAKNKIFKQLRPTYLRYADVFARMGFPIAMQKVYFAAKPTLSVSVEKQIDLSKKRIGFAPFAAHVGKQYPFVSMKQVIELIAKNPKYDVFIFGGGEKENKQAQELSHLPNVHNTIGKLSFSEELQLIARLDVMVAMDSGNAHLSAMYGIPTITLWGVTHIFAGFYPYNQPLEYALLSDRDKYPLLPTSVYGNKYPEGYDKAMETIAVESVVNLINKVIEKGDN